MGANPAENHPCGFKWALEARDENNAKLVTIDPRFTRTSAVADKHLQIRPGSDIAILGGFIRHILTNDLHHADYVRAHTKRLVHRQRRLRVRGRAVLRVRRGRQPVRQDVLELRAGRGWLRASRPDAGRPAVRLPASQAALRSVHISDGGADRRLLRGEVPRDGRHRLLDRSGRPGRHHHVRGRVDHAHRRQPDHPHRGDSAAAAGQYRAGRAAASTPCVGTPTCRVATDHAIVAGILPGYLKVPRPEQTTLAEHLEASTPQPLVPDTVNYWGNYPKFMVSQLKAWFGDSANGGQRVRLSLFRQAGRRRHLAVDLGRGLPRATRGVHHARVQPTAGRTGRPRGCCSRCRV